MGVEVVDVPFAEFNEAWKRPTRTSPGRLPTAGGRRGQDRGRQPRDARNLGGHVSGQKAVLKKHGANAITINCLGGFYGGHIHAYPCLGFHELNNDGLIGGCECDVRSAATMVTMNAPDPGPARLHLRPGDRHVEAADHLCPLRGVEQGVRPGRPDESLRDSHALRGPPGGSVRSILPTGYMTTTLEFSPERKQILFHQGKAVGQSRRPGLPHEAGRRARRRHREALPRVGPVGLAPGDLLRRRRAGFRPGRRPRLEGGRRGLTGRSGT